MVVLSLLMASSGSWETGWWSQPWWQPAWTAWSWRPAPWAGGRGGNDGGGTKRSRQGDEGQMPMGQWVYARKWPVSIAGYPAPEMPNSWREARELAAQDYGCTLQLSGKYTGKRLRRPPTLTIKGPRAEACFKAIWWLTMRAGINCRKAAAQSSRS